MTAATELFDAEIDYTGPLPLEEESRLIAAAHDGDYGAYEALLYQYRPALRALVASEQRRTSGTVDPDESRANALLAFAEALHVTQPGERIAARLKAALLRAADEYHLIGTLTVPYRTRRKYLQALRDAHGNLTEARAIAASRGMLPETFTAVRQAIATGTWTSTNGLLAGEYGGPELSQLTHERGYATIEDAADAQRALDTLDDTSRTIVRDYYGFNDYDMVPDAEIAHRMGFSRSKVQRLRDGALETMHGALCSDGQVDDRCERPEAHAGAEEVAA